ncbi:rhamnan synthesis F family protein [Neokomagataea thailandica]|nr:MULTISPECIES: rhamnan synthesis F family protein [Neokomagataea]
MLRPVCLFAYFDPAPTLAPHTRHLLHNIHEAGFEIHIAVSSLEPHDNLGLITLQKSFAQGPTPIPARLYPRFNHGLDFGAWQDLIHAGCAQHASEILLANDSVFGAIQPLPPIIETMRKKALPVWGMVRSEAVTQHLQSWFLTINRDAFEHPALQRIFTQPFHSMSKEEIILHGELGLGLAMRHAGWDLTSCWSSQRGLAKLLATNPMHTDWRNVLLSGRAPFIKTELLRDNPSGIVDTHKWRTYLAQASHPTPGFFSPDWIEHYLHRTPRRVTAPSPRFRARAVQALASQNRWQALRHLLLP